MRRARPPRPRDLYGPSKQVAEDVGRHVHRRDGLSVLCPRPVTFIPCDDVEGALAPVSARRLPPEESVRAHALAAETGIEGFDAAFHGPATPCMPATVVACRSDPAAVLEGCYPGVASYFAAVVGELPEDPHPGRLAALGARAGARSDAAD